jgi:tripartite-type tricarboxylate transporter receptor subunit TctC
VIQEFCHHKFIGGTFMKLLRRQFLRLATGAAAAPALPRIARAQAYPTRPITMVVTFPAGSAMDTGGRIVAERMRAALRQPVIIENISGANGIIGVSRVARAAPDGYTLVIGIWNTHVANGALYPLPYDVQADFEPISLLLNVSYLIVARKTMPPNDLQGFIAWLKANPDMATEGTSGVGSAQHVGGVLFQKLTDTRFQFIPYRGGEQAMQDLVAGRIDWTMAVPTTVVPQLSSGNIKAFATTATSRLATAPDSPTVDEAGLPGFYLSNWSGVWAPKRTPKPVIAKLNAAMVEALSDAGVRQRLADIGQEIFPREQQTPEALAAFQKAEIEKWWPIIKAAGIKGE